MSETSERLAKLLEAGASAFDEPEVRHIRRLVERAETEALEAVSARLLARASARLARLEAEMDTAREGARAVLSQVEKLDSDSAYEVSELFRAGRYREASRLGLSRIRSHDPEAPARLFARIAKIESRAAAHGIRLPAELRSQVQALRNASPLGTAGLRRGRIVTTELSIALFDGILSRSRSSFGIRRIGRRDHLPEQVGPYNPRVVATRTLDKLARLSPEYLRIWFDLLADLSALERLSAKPAPPAKKGTAKAPRTPRGAKDS